MVYFTTDLDSTKGVDIVMEIWFQTRSTAFFARQTFEVQIASGGIT
jgi:hypothetical protein